MYATNISLRICMLKIPPITGRAGVRLPAPPRNGGQRLHLPPPPRGKAAARLSGVKPQPCVWVHATDTQPFFLRVTSRVFLKIIMTLFFVPPPPTIRTLKRSLIQTLTNKMVLSGRSCPERSLVKYPSGSVMWSVRSCQRVLSDGRCQVTTSHIYIHVYRNLFRIGSARIFPESAF